MICMDLTERINSHEFLYLVDIGEPGDNVLRLVVQEARANIPPQQDSSEAPSRSWGSIIPTDDCVAYEITFRSYVAYSVWNESLATGDSSEEFTGRLFRVYSKSRFLDYVSREALVVDLGDGMLYPGFYQHFAIICLNHVVHVASVDQPSIVVS